MFFILVDLKSNDISKRVGFALKSGINGTQLNLELHFLMLSNASLISPFCNKRHSSRHRSVPLETTQAIKEFFCIGP